MQNFLNLPATAFQLTDGFVQATRNLHTLVSPGHKLNKPEVLFRNITEEEQAALYERWGHWDCVKADTLQT